MPDVEMPKLFTVKAWKILMLLLWGSRFRYSSLKRVVGGLGFRV